MSAPGTYLRKRTHSEYSQNNIDPDDARVAVRAKLRAQVSKENQLSAQFPSHNWDNFVNTNDFDVADGSNGMPGTPVQRFNFNIKTPTNGVTQGDPFWCKTRDLQTMLSSPSARGTVRGQPFSEQMPVDAFNVAEVNAEIAQDQIDDAHAKGFVAWGNGRVPPHMLDRDYIQRVAEQYKLIGTVGGGENATIGGTAQPPANRFSGVPAGSGSQTSLTYRHKQVPAAVQGLARVAANWGTNLVTGTKLRFAMALVEVPATQEYLVGYTTSANSPSALRKKLQFRSAIVAPSAMLWQWIPVASTDDGIPGWLIDQRVRITAGPKAEVIELRNKSYVLIHLGRLRVHYADYMKVCFPRQAAVDYTYVRQIVDRSEMGAMEVVLDLRPPEYHIH